MSDSPFFTELRWRPVPGNPNAIDVNLDFDPQKLCPDCEIVWRWGRQTGWVRLELKEGELYRDGGRVALYFDPAQVGSGGSLQGHALFESLKQTMNDALLHPNERAALLAYPHLFPSSWKVGTHGCILYTYFGAVGFRNRHNNQVFVFGVYFLDGVWRGVGSDLSGRWGVLNPSACAMPAHQQADP